MKRSLLGFRGVLALVLVALVVGVAGLWWWKSTELEREIVRLRQAVEHLTASYPIVRVVVTEQSVSATGSTQTLLRLWFVDEQGRRLGGPGEVSLVGEKVYFEALVIAFADPLVASGERRAMAFPTRLFTEATPPERGFALEALDERGVPTIYERGLPPSTSGLSAQAFREVLRRFWELANAPDEAAAYGIDVLQGQAVFTEYEVGRYYSIFVEADGGLTIRPELHWIE